MINDWLELAGREGAGKDGKAESWSTLELDRLPMKHVKLSLKFVIGYLRSRLAADCRPPRQMFTRPAYID